jgi:hypothetical protein
LSKGPWKTRFIGWALDARDREQLLARFPPVYPDVVADHVTLASGVSTDTPIPAERSGLVVGRADDGEGVEALVVEIGGTTDRPDGGTYHLTWSIDRARGREAKHSNDVIARCGWAPFDEPLPIRLEPRRYPS